MTINEPTSIATNWPKPAINQPNSEPENQPNSYSYIAYPGISWCPHPSDACWGKSRSRNHQCCGRPYWWTTQIHTVLVLCSASIRRCLKGIRLDDNSAYLTGRYKSLMWCWASIRRWLKGIQLVDNSTYLTGRYKSLGLCSASIRRCLKGIQLDDNSAYLTGRYKSLGLCWASIRRWLKGIQLDDNSTYLTGRYKSTNLKGYVEPAFVGVWKAYN